MAFYQNELFLFYIHDPGECEEYLFLKSTNGRIAHILLSVPAQAIRCSQKYFLEISQDNAAVAAYWRLILAVCVVNTQF